ncbi:MAG: AbrB/MazE/SpoVT family DNA-binding domain-containing protein [Candidatus Woesearchaeota archaeon]
MKCPQCNGLMKKQKDSFPEDGIEYEMLKCMKCGEELLDMEQMRDLAGKYRKLRRSREVRFNKWGNSLAVRIPRETANELGIKEGTSAVLTTEKHGIMIRPMS